MAVKKTGVAVNFMGEEFRKFLKAIETEDRGSIALGETGGPLLDLYETADAIVVEADLPGVDVHDLEVSILNGLLVVEGVKREKVEEVEKINYLCMERSFDTFRRALKITVPVNPKGAAANYSRGVLTVSFPKLKDKRGERVRIKIEKL